MFCSRVFLTPPPRVLKTRFGAICIDFGTMLVPFWDEFGLEFRDFRTGNFERKSCKDPAQNPAEDLGNPTRMHKL